jgi:hypothetical protein
MSPRSKKEYLEAIFLHYKKASHKEKAPILDEFCAACGYHRKHAIRVLRRFKRFRQPHPRNEEEVFFISPILSLNPSAKSGELPISPVPNASRLSCPSGSLVMLSPLVPCLHHLISPRSQGMNMTDAVPRLFSCSTIAVTSVKKWGILR